MNRFFGYDLDLDFKDGWTESHAAAAQAFRDFFWPEGKENRGIAIDRRVAYSNRTGIGSLIKAMGHMDDQCLLTTALWLQGHGAFHRAMAVALLVHHWPDGEEEIYRPPSDREALEYVANAPVESIVEEIKGSFGRPPHCYIHDHFLSVVHLLPPQWQ